MFRKDQTTQIKHKKHMQNTELQNLRFSLLMKLTRINLIDPMKQLCPNELIPGTDLSEW